MGGKSSFPVQPLPKERIVIVTGGNKGIGYETAKWIAIMGATVILACRSEERACQAIERMKKEFTRDKEQLLNEGVKIKNEQLSVEFMKLDLTSFTSVLDFVEDFKNQGRQLHVLVCNAGIGMVPLKITEDGFESILQTNYLGHFLVIIKLIPLMKSSGEDCRIHLVSSAAHNMCTFNLATMNYDGDQEHFRSFDYYARSKLYQVMQTFALARRLKDSNVTVTCSHPGTVDTEFENLSDVWPVKAYYSVKRTTGSLLTPFEGSKTPINAIVNPELRGVSGVYLDGCKISTPNPTSRSEDNQEQLWRQTLEYLTPHVSVEDIRCLENHRDSANKTLGEGISLDAIQCNVPYGE